jgi:hypothetical protein
VHRVGEKLGWRSFLYDLPKVHDAYLMAHVSDRGQVVGD